MPEQLFTHRMTCFQTWRQAQLRRLQKLQAWLRQQGLHTEEARYAIDRARQALLDGRLTVAVAGEFSRGKTELINALFFADDGRQLLPAGAGRTTLCPAEIYSDPQAPPQLRLLPIESRRDDRSLASLRLADDQWSEFDLDPDDPETVCARLQLLTEQKRVSIDEAAELGLLGEPDEAMGEWVSIPRWRLALVNLPHPLLAQGLRILDTPGLNACGSEPELTYEMLPAAHAIVFVLAADTGVSRSDLQIWQRYVKRQGRASKRRVIVVLNKTDMLWDELRSSAEIVETIVRQCREVAQTLGVDEDQVFATSARKGLLARVTGDTALEQRSGITGLETCLGEIVTVNRMAIIRHEHTILVEQAIEVLETLIERRLDRNGQQGRRLADLADKSDAAIAEMLGLTQSDHDRYQSHLDAYRRHLAGFERHRSRLMESVDVKRLDLVFEEIRETMTGAWTTHGLKEAMRALFNEVDARIDSASIHTQAMRRLVRTMYRRTKGDDHFHLPTPPMFSIVRHQVELSLLDQEAEVFRNSASTTLMEQHFVTKRYYRTIVVRAKAIIRQANDEATHWVDHVLLPLANEMKEYRETLAQQIEYLHQACESRKTIQQRIETLARDAARLRTQLSALARIRSRLDEQLPQPGRRVSGRN